MTLGIGVKGADAYEAMDAVFDLEVAVGVFPFDDETGIFDPCFISRLVVESFDLKPMPFRPAEVHSVEHTGPILRFRSSSTGVDRDDGVGTIVFATEHHLHFEGIDMLIERFGILVEHLEGLFVPLRFGEIEVLLCIGEGIVGRIVRGKDTLGTGLLLRDLPRRFRIRPKCRFLLHLIDRFEAGTEGVGLDDVGDVVHFGGEAFEHFAVFVCVHG